MRNFRIPQPIELNICDFCFKDIITRYGSTFLKKHYSFCSNDCKEKFLKETEDFLNESDTKLEIFHCNWCKGPFKSPRVPTIENELVFCSEICADIKFGRKSAFHWRK